MSDAAEQELADLYIKAQKLRSALKRIVDLYDDDAPLMRHIARAALEGK